jgi:HSP20 family molecular chaperone IbpA
MAKQVPRQALAMLRAMFPDLPDWPESPRTALLAFSSPQTFRVEELVRDSHYVIRAELSGLDPANDIEVTVDGRTLTIYAERWQKDDEPHRTEFRYGPLTPSVRLPARVDAQDITASYRKGILEVSVPIPAAEPEGGRIPIENADVGGSSRATEAAAGSTATSRLHGASIPSTLPSFSRPALPASVCDCKRSTTGAAPVASPGLVVSDFA